jgi:hypothetical protein
MVERRHGAARVVCAGTMGGDSILRDRWLLGKRWKLSKKTGLYKLFSILEMNQIDPAKRLRQIAKAR